MSDEGLLRLRRFSEFQPLLAAWRASGPAGAPPLSSLEIDTVALALSAIESRQYLQVAIPGGRSRVPLLIAVAAAAEPLLRASTPHPRGAVAFVTRSVLRRAELDELDAAAVSVAPALHPRRLRGDGYVCRSGGGGIGPLEDEHRLLFVSPIAGFPSPIGGPVRAVVVDDTQDPDGTLAAAAFEWAVGLGVPVVACTHLLAARPPGCVRWAWDWPWLTTMDMTPGLDASSSAASGRVAARVVADARVEPLFRARARLARLGDRPAPWPGPLAAASRFARLLVDLAVPPDVYDAHVPHTIARSLTRRRDDLEATSPDALVGPWRDVAETDWGPLKTDLLAAHDALIDVNQKANALGLLVEECLTTQERVHIMCSSGVSVAATRSWLLEGGFAGIMDAFTEDRLRVVAASEAGAWDQHLMTVLPGIPPYRHRHRLLDGDVGRVTVCCYPTELARLGGGIDRLLNERTETEEAERAETLKSAVGASATLAGRRVTIQVEATDAYLAGELEAADFIDLAEAEVAALTPADAADDMDDGEDNDRMPPSRWVPARALLVEPVSGGDAVGLLVAERGPLDRVAGGRVRSVRPSDVAAGMLIVGLTGADRRTLFARLRPYLDALHGPGTRVRLDIWREGLRRALALAGGPPGLGQLLRASGAQILDAAIAAWPSPYRIGPRDHQNIARVGSIAGVQFLCDDAKPIGEVMEAVRRRHRTIGVRVAAAVRAAATGRADAFDRLESQLGVQVAELLGDLTPWRVLAVSDAGWARRVDLWRALPFREAEMAFHRRPADDVTPVCETGLRTTSDEDAL